VPHCETLIRNVLIIDGSGADPLRGEVSIADGRILHAGKSEPFTAERTVDGAGKVLAPGFIDVHTHDDLYAIRCPEMLPKLSQGVTTVVVGNCGISAAPVVLNGRLTPPMNLLGNADAFRYPSFAEYVAAVERVRPAVNVSALVGHTSLRNNHLDRFDRSASPAEISAMRAQLAEALDHGALGLSTGLAYRAAHSASESEVASLSELLARAGGVYATHLRTESDNVLDAMKEAFRIGQHAGSPIVISHLKCNGIDNWGRASDLLNLLQAQKEVSVGWDCYPYAASSTILDPDQIDERITIVISWAENYPELAGRKLSEIARAWGTNQAEAARRLQPAGAIYHSISEDDMRAILRDPGTMIGSDGLPNDRFPHPRLWGTFPRVLGRYSREEKLFSLSEAVRKMTSLPAKRFGLRDRGLVREGYAADLVLFEPETVLDRASFEDPAQPAQGIDAVWVNGVLSYSEQQLAKERAGKFLRRRGKNEL
jgi:N-acyl-D-amino-acid deacylase